MLSDIAYKHGARWIWQSDIEATAIVGLGANPSRAAADACWLALDTHEAIAGIKDDLALDLGASIAIVRGIAAGSRDGDGHLVRFSLHDPATFLADTLARATPRSRTWVAGGVYRIVRREFGWGDAPSLAVKPPPGTLLPGTMRVYALERSLSREERSLGSASAPSDLVGRDIEKAELHAAYHRAVSGRGGEGEAMFRAVIGEQGIGKTVLVATFATELPPNARLVRVECSPVRAELPLYAVTELVRDILGTTGEEPFEEVCTIIARAGGGAAQGDSTSPMVARLAELVTNRPLAGGNREDAATRRRWIAAGLRNLFAAIALQQPLVVVIEGLQWADKASLDLFLDTMRPPDPLPILLVVVTRPDDRVAPLLDGLVRIELRGLSTEEQVRLVEARLGVREGVRQVCADLMPKVAGNPFFLLEMVDALLERGTLEIREATHEEGGGFLTPGETRYALVRTDRTDSPGAALPETLEQLVGDRLAELPAEERALVGWLAVAGGPLGPPELSALGGVALGEAAIRLCARGLCDRKGDVIDFRHPLTRDVAYAALGSLDREKAHLELGEHWAKTSLARGQSAAIVARHLALGGNGDRAADFYLEAARAARASYQTQLAVRYYTRAVNLLPPGDARTFAAHEALEATYRVIGRRRERIRHLQALRRVARKVATPRATVIALLRTARFDLDEGRPARGLPVARKAAELARWAALPAFEVEAEELASLLLRELGDVEGALHACDRALFACDPKATSSLPSRVRADVLHSRGILLRWVGRVKEAIASFVEAIAVFRRTGARRQEAETKSSLGHAMFASGRYEDAVALSLESIQIEISIGGRFQIAKTLATIGLAYARLGDLPRAQAYMARARDSHERYGDQDGRAETFLVSAQIMIEEEDYDQADSFVRDAAALNAVAEGTYIATQVAIVRSSLARVRGDAQIALEQAILARQLAERVTLVDSHLYAIALEASARIDLGDVHAATLAASTALGAVEALEGCEHGLEIRALSTSALACAGSKEAPLARQRAAAYAVSLLSTIRDPRLRRSFAHRRLVQSLFDTSALRSAPPGDKPDGDARIASGGGGGA
jgi:tetratricopeptide (TPR) repeat protein